MSNEQWAMKQMELPGMPEKPKSAAKKEVTVLPNGRTQIRLKIRPLNAKEGTVPSPSVSTE